MSDNIREVEVGEYADGSKIMMKIDMAALIRKAMGWPEQGVSDD